MKFSIAATTAILAAPLALAAPQSDNNASSIEQVKITNFVGNTSSDGSISVSFKLSGDYAKNLSCSAENPTVSYNSADAVQCGDTDYLFNVISTADQGYEISIFHRYESQGSGYFSPGQYGVGTVLVSCSYSADGRTCKQTQSPASLPLTGQ